MWTSEQLDAINKTGKNMLVSAAAGSGKTAVLTERIISKLDEIDISNLLVVTFTKAAASEMKERIIKKIYEKVKENRENVNLSKQLLLVNKASIMTIDALCLEIVKSNFEKVNVDPNFKIPSNEEINIMQKDALKETFRSYYENEDEMFLEVLECYSSSKNDNGLKEIVLNIYRFINSFENPKKWFNSAVDALENEKLNNIIKKEEELLKKSVESDILECIHIANMPSAPVAYVESFEDDLEELRCKELTNITFKTLKRASKECDETIKLMLQDKRKKYKADITKYAKTVTKLSEEDEEKFNEVVYKRIKKIKEIVYKFEKEYKKIKDENLYLEFNDISHLAIDILKDENTLKKYKAKYEEIYIDEYQDSNNIQEYILTSISRGNNIFMVGDVKQSIYKFRLAKPELFMDKYDKYKEDGGILVNLTKNFRSHENVVDFINKVFSKIMDRKNFEIDYDEKAKLNTGIESVETEKPVINIISKSENDKLKNEAKFIVNEILKLKEEKIYDKSIGDYRDVEYKDIGILTRSTKGIVGALEREFRSLNIPHFADIKEGYFDSFEVKDIISFLKIIDNPRQDIYLLAVLRAYFYKVTDNELLEIRKSFKYGDFYEALTYYKETNFENMDLKEKIEKFFNELKYFRQYSKDHSVDKLINEIYLKTGYYNYVASVKPASKRISNLNLLIIKAREYENIVGKSLFSFINYVEEIKVSNSDVGSAKDISENDNVIRIMSIHKSKGLEFPIVIVAGCGKKFNKSDIKEKIILNEDYGIATDYIDLDKRVKIESTKKYLMKKKIDRENIAEQLRILYVALTRAKNKLIMTAEVSDVDKYREKVLGHKFISSKTKASSFLDWLILVDNLNFNFVDEEVVVDENEKEKEKEKNYSLENLDFKYEASTDVVTVTVSELKRRLTEETIYKEKLLIRPKFMKEYDGLSPSEKGIAVHTVMQHLDFENINNIEDQLADMVIKEKITKEEKDVIDIKNILKIKDDNIYSKIVKAKKVYKEVPFVLKEKVEEISDSKILIQGIIDMYLEDEDDNIILLDWKTDKLKEVEIINKYKVQLELYKKALEKSLKKKVAETYIYSFHLNKSIKI